MADLTEIQRSSYVRIAGGDEINSAYVDSENRLWVNTFALPTETVYETKYLLNGSNKEMNVNGSVTPVSFLYSSVGIEYLESITVLFYDSGVNAVNNFGTLVSLTNGLIVEVQSNGVLYTLSNLQDNGDVAMFFVNNFQYSPTSAGFLNDQDMFVGSSIFNRNIILKQSEGDFIRARVRDNLTGFNFLRMSVKIWKEA